MNQLIEALAKTKLFKGLTIGEIEDLFKRSRPVLQKFARDEYIAHATETCDYLMLLLSGEVVTYMEDKEGKILQLEAIKSPDVLASAVLFSTDAVLPVDIVARTDCRILFIRKDKILDYCQRNEKFLKNLLCDMGDRLLFLAKKLHELTFGTLRSRIAKYIVQHAKEDEFILPVSKEELARFFAVPRPSVSRVFMQFEREGILIQNGRKIKILDRSSLEKLSEKLGDDYSYGEL